MELAMLSLWQKDERPRKKISRRSPTGHAVGEAFGYYFNEEGEVVHKVPTIGLQLEDLSHIEHVIAVAGGSSKAKAIRAYMKSAPSFNRAHHG